MIKLKRLKRLRKQLHYLMEMWSLRTQLKSLA